MKFLSTTSNDDDTWISAADMMAGLMMIFLFIAVIYIENVNKLFDEVSDVRDDICDDLVAEFSQDIDRWNMSICEGGLLIRFQSDSSFERASSRLSPSFRILLDNFIPRLMEVVWEYNESISELRIEGHTDSTIKRTDTPLSGYIYNTELSQNRSRNVMSYALNIPSIASNSDYLDWSFSSMTAHGMSSSDLIKAGNTELYDKSRRVEFRMKTRAEEKLLNRVTELKRNEAL
ncbi:OmpA family protein [SAR92 clade bacterium H921]|nr:OmpA family protein [SAR92 clade bacterium H921]